MYVAKSETARENSLIARELAALPQKVSRAHPPPPAMQAKGNIIGKYFRESKWVFGRNPSVFTY